MGYYAHDIVIATTASYRPGGLPDVEAFRESLPEWMRKLVIGPFVDDFTEAITCIFLPDGSKEGWPPSDEAAEARTRFAELFNQRYEDGSSCDVVVAVTYGGDYQYDAPAPTAKYLHRSSPDEEES